MEYLAEKESFQALSDGKSVPATTVALETAQVSSLLSFHFQTIGDVYKPCGVRDIFPAPARRKDITNAAVAFQLPTDF